MIYHHIIIHTEEISWFNTLSTKVGPSFKRTKRPHPLAKSHAIIVQTAGHLSIKKYGGIPDCACIFGLLVSMYCISACRIHRWFLGSSDTRKNQKKYQPAPMAPVM